RDTTVARSPARECARRPCEKPPAPLCSPAPSPRLPPDAAPDPARVVCCSSWPPGRLGVELPADADRLRKEAPGGSAGGVLVPKRQLDQDVRVSQWIGRACLAMK